MKSIFALLCLLLFTRPSADTVLTRFKTPAGCTQVKPQPGSFGEWLQSLPLKPAGTHTLLTTAMWPPPIHTPRRL